MGNDENTPTEQENEEKQDETGEKDDDALLDSVKLNLLICLCLYQFCTFH